MRRTRPNALTDRARVLHRVMFACALMATMAVTQRASADESFWSNIYLRGGLLQIWTLDNSADVELSDVGGPASLAIDNGPIEGAKAGVGSASMFAVTLGYVLPWGGDKLSVEGIVLALPFPVTLELTAEGSLATESLAPLALDSIPTEVPPLGRELGSTKAIPPVFTLVYNHFRGKMFQPYLGAGVGYLIPVSCDVTNTILTEVVKPECEVDRVSFGNLGFVGQVGLQLAYGKLFLNVDLKYIEKLNVKATIKDVYVNTPGLPLFESVRVGDTTAEVGVDPLLLQIAAGASF